MTRTRTRKFRKFVANIIALTLMTMMIGGFILFVSAPAEELGTKEFIKTMVVKSIIGLGLMFGGGYMANKLY